MTKKTKPSKEYLDKYFEVLKKFNLTPDFKLTDFEKDIIKNVDSKGTMTTYELADIYDLRPSEVNELVNDLVTKGVLVLAEGEVTLTENAIKYIHADKSSRKAEKKFRKFLNCLNEEDLDTFMGLVNSFVIAENKQEVVEGEENNG